MVNGLNKSEALRYCGSEELFIDVVNDFYKLIDSECDKLTGLLNEGNIYDYTIEVHALKNSSKLIGAIDLSELFYHMEMSGKNNDVDEIHKCMPKLLELYRSYKDILKGYVVQSDTKKIKATREQIIAILADLFDAVDDSAVDIDRADSAMKKLNEYVFPPNLQSLIEELSVCVTSLATDDIRRLIDEICNKLKSMSTVMVIDDDLVNVKAVTYMLSEEYNVVAARSGKEAFDLLNKENVDLILLDVHMPEMDGHEIIRELKSNEEWMEIPVIFLTSDIDNNTEIQGFNEGAIDFIRKPFRKGVTIQRIRRILELSYLQKNLKLEVEKQTEVAENRRKSMERLSLQMVQALANTIDAKDSYTNGHSTRVARYSVMIARRMGYTEEKLEHLYYAAILHDIGKIGIPREIINKPSRLTDEEYEIIKTHPAIGENILKEITEIPDIAIGARWHHERYDGKGYPDGLKGIEIPKLARIIGVADAYDAMTSKRSYRDILSQETVRSEIEKCKGTQFDPVMAEIMLELMDEDDNYTMHE